MNYEPNTTHWKRGDLVLQDYDHKSPEMLMRVIGYTRNGLVKTKYITARFRNSSHTKSLRDMRTIWLNEPKYLHDPARFGVDVKSEEVNAILADATP